VSRRALTLLFDRAEHPWLQGAKTAPNVPLGDVVRARLKQFAVMNRFKKKAMRVIAEHLSAEEVELIKEMFALMDTERKGRVTLPELKAGLAKVGSKLADASGLIATNDSNLNLLSGGARQLADVNDQIRVQVLGSMGSIREVVSGLIAIKEAMGDDVTFDELETTNV
jgi:hypothetical protein